MCGRFTLTSPPETIAERFDLDETPVLAPRYNIAPGQDVATVEAGGEPGEKRRLALRRWGLVPGWAKDPSVGYRMINARVETAGEKPAFREAFQRRRCLVPADGFFEWSGDRTSRQPWFLHLAERELFAFAGLWERWRDPSGEAGDALETCTILTTDANAAVRPLHDRMPVILPPDAWARWLDRDERDAAEIAALLAPGLAAEIHTTTVGLRVNDAGSEGPECIEPAAPQPVQERLL